MVLLLVRATLLISLLCCGTARADVAQDCFSEDGAKGIAACTAAIATRPKVKRNFVYRSAKYSEMRQFELALDDAKRPLELDPKSGGARAVLARALLGLKKFDQAIEEASKAIALEPTMAGGYLERAHGLLAQQQFDLAIADLNELIALDGQWAREHTIAKAYALRAIAQSCLGAFESAIADAAQALQRDPKFLTALIVRASAYRAKGEIERAIDDEKSAAALRGPGNVIESDQTNLCQAT